MHVSIQPDKPGISLKNHPVIPSALALRITLGYCFSVYNTVHGAPHACAQSSRSRTRSPLTAGQRLAFPAQSTLPALLKLPSK